MIYLNVEIGARLRQFRENLDLSQREFSKCIDISQSYCSMLERGTLTINPLIMRTIYENFNISVDWLITGEGDIFRRGKTSK
jgi:transcriptional regulator with XRE-family HTH domain